ncbi:MAG: hypothetical protein ABWZ78_09700 [Burkholderiaceae bacterium]
MPRWIPPVLCTIYIVAGLFGRDPWRTDDAAGFGVARTMASGSTIDWLLPNIEGVLVPRDGPLPFWIGALAMRAAVAINPVLDGALPGARITADLALRATTALGLALAFALMWYACYGFARRPEIQPDDPIGIAASRRDFGRAVADSALLALLGTFGLIARLHETTADTAQFVWMALYLFGLSWSLERPRSGGALVGLALGATFLTKGAPLAVVLLGCTAIMLVSIRSFRLVSAWILIGLLPMLVVTVLAWPSLVVSLARERALFGVPLAVADNARIEISRFIAFWKSSNWHLVSGPSVRSARYYLRAVAWFFWPLWPFAGWALWRWSGSRLEAPLAVPAILLVALAVLAIMHPDGTEATLLPMVPPMALLAALSLPTIQRSIVSLVDWFAVATFSLVGLVVWAYWFAVMTGRPQRMSEKARHAIPGFVAEFNLLELGLGLVLTLAWVTLVAWRISRRPRPFWRPMVLSSGGMVLAWFLLMTLWLPAANYRKSYRELASQIRPLIAGDACVVSQGLDGGQRALFAYYAAARFRRLPALNGSVSVPPTASCPWLLISDRIEDPHNVAGLEDDWRLTWQGQRPMNRGEQLYLYRRRDDPPTSRGENATGSGAAPR